MAKASSPVMTQGEIRSSEWNNIKVKICIRCHFNEKSITSSNFPEFIDLLEHPRYPKKIFQCVSQTGGKISFQVFSA